MLHHLAIAISSFRPTHTVQIARDNVSEKGHFRLECTARMITQRHEASCYHGIILGSQESQGLALISFVFVLGNLATYFFFIVL
jgi:hypothetical protein